MGSDVGTQLIDCQAWISSGYFGGKITIFDEIHKTLIYQTIAVYF